jgi:hypothetical protein
MLFLFFCFISDLLLCRRDSLLVVEIRSQQEIKMRIHSGINGNNELRSVFHVGIILLLTLKQHTFLDTLDMAQKSVLILRMPNVTSFEPDLHFGIPYNDCHCSVVLTKYCLTDKQLKISRVLPLVLYVLQIYFTRDFLSISGNHTCFFVSVLWIVAMFGFIGFLVAIYVYNYYYGYAISYLCGTGYSQFFFIWYEVGIDGHRRRSIRNNNNMINNQTSTEIDN